MAKLTPHQLALQRLKEAQAALEESSKQEALRLGQLAVAAGLADLGLTDREYSRMFDELVAAAPHGPAGGEASDRPAKRAAGRANGSGAEPLAQPTAGV